MASKNNKEQDVLIEQTDFQRDPYRARGQDFEISPPNGPAEMETPGHGQCGDTKREQAKLLAERKETGKGAPVATSVDDAAAPHTK